MKEKIVRFLVKIGFNRLAFQVSPSLYLQVKVAEPLIKGLKQAVEEHYERTNNERDTDNTETD